MKLGLGDAYWVCIAAIAAGAGVFRLMLATWDWWEVREWRKFEESMRGQRDPESFQEALEILRHDSLFQMAESMRDTT